MSEEINETTFGEKLSLLWPELEKRIQRIVMNDAAKSEDIAQAGAVVFAGTAILQGLQKIVNEYSPPQRPQRQKLHTVKRHA